MVALTTYGDIAADSYEGTSISNLDGWTRINTVSNSSLGIWDDGVIANSTE